MQKLFLHVNHSLLRDHYSVQPSVGLDFWSNETENWPLACGKYLPELIGQRAELIIKDHNKNHKEEPLFLLVASNAPHAGGDRPFQAEYPPSRSNATDFIIDPERKNLADIMRYLDDTLGNLTTTLKSEGMLNDTVIIFLGDNGGPSIDPKYGYGNAASNFPFRGTKMSTFDGGVRVPAILWKSGLDASPRVYDNLFHMVDWLPTLNSATGGDVLDGLDGVDQWAALSGMSADTPRKELLVEIYDEESSWGYLKDNFKYVKSFGNSSGFHFTNDYWSPHPDPAKYRSEEIQNSPVAKALGANIDAQTLSDLRSNLMVTPSCSEGEQSKATFHDCSVDGCLFDISKDPSECNDVSETYPDVKKELIDRINSYLAEMVIPDKPLPNTPNSRNFFAPSSGETARSIKFLVGFLSMLIYLSR
uniref:Arylsulfatase I n=1 Tax=Lygus hesperus TaxID=30085 RepID=A0A0K8TFB8_LYGHE